MLNENTFSTQPNLEDWSRALSSFHEMNSLNSIHPIFQLHAILQELSNEMSVQRDAILNTIIEDTPKKQGLEYQDAQGDLRISLGTVSGGPTAALKLASMSARNPVRAACSAAVQSAHERRQALRIQELSHLSPFFKYSLHPASKSVQELKATSPNVCCRRSSPRQP